jgi:hypothetical protein
LFFGASSIPSDKNEAEAPRTGMTIFFDARGAAYLRFKGADLSLGCSKAFAGMMTRCAEDWCKMSFDLEMTVSMDLQATVGVTTAGGTKYSCDSSVMKKRRIDSFSSIYMPERQSKWHGVAAYSGKSGTTDWSILALP